MLISQTEGKIGDHNFTLKLRINGGRSRKTSYWEVMGWLLVGATFDIPNFSPNSLPRDTHSRVSVNGCKQLTMPLPYVLSCVLAFRFE